MTASIQRRVQKGPRKNTSTKTNRTDRKSKFHKQNLCQVQLFQICTRLILVTEDIIRPYKSQVGSPDISEAELVQPDSTSYAALPLIILSACIIIITH
jgi:hypothetical protein